MAAPAVVDVFPYNGEAIVARRLAYLDPVVDRFVVVEARHTHAGTRKPELFAKSSKVFEKYLHKTDIVVVDSFPEPGSQVSPTLSRELHQPWVGGNRDAWWREGFQRDAALPVLAGLHVKLGRFVAMVCDSDEIPSHEAIDVLRSGYDTVAAKGMVHLDMAFHYYSFQWTKPEPWVRAFCVTDTTLPESLTGVRHTQPRAVMNHAGWHCSYFMTPEEIARKVQSFAHREFDSREHTDPQVIAARVLRGSDVFDRAGQDLVRTPDDVLAQIPRSLALAP